MAMHWRRVERPSPSLAVGMPKGMTGATLFESGDGVWIHLMGDPTKSPMFTDAIAVVRPDGPEVDPGTLLPADRRVAGGLAAAPERRVAGVVLGERRSRAARRAAGRDLR